MAKNTLIDDEKPNLHISEKDLPAIKDMEVDKDYVLVVKVKLTGLSRPQYYDKPKLHADFRVEEVKSDKQPDDFEKGMDSVKE